MTSNKKSVNSSKKGPSSDQSFSLISDETFRRMYAAMLGCRLLVQRSRRELRGRQSQKKQPLAPRAARPLVGQEAVIVGATLELRADDTITAPSGEVVFREPSRRKPAGKVSQAQQALVDSRRNVIAFAESTGAQLTIGTGVALALKDAAGEVGDGRIVVAFGDANPESMSSWNEALHLAGAHQLPIIFVLRPGLADERNSAASVAAVAEQAGLSGVIAIPVDYTDVVAMYRVSFESIARARKGTGATLIVGMPFMVEGKAAPSNVQSHDPIKRMEDYLKKKGLFSAKWKAGVMRQLK